MTAQVVLIRRDRREHGWWYLPTVHARRPTKPTCTTTACAPAAFDRRRHRSRWMGMSEAALAELTYQTGAQSAEYQVGGVAMNAIPREGGNRFRGRG